MKSLIKDLANQNDLNPDQLLCFAVEYHNKYSVFDFEDNIWDAKTTTGFVNDLIKDFKHQNRKGHDWREKLVSESLDDFIK